MNEWKVVQTTPVLPRLLTPIGYSAFRCIRECPVHFAFSRDHRYPPRTNPKARLGTAFHESLVFLYANRPSTLGEVMQFFDEAIQKQRAEALLNSRERRLPWPKNVREAMENVLALRVSKSHKLSNSHLQHCVELTLLSPDGLLIGRPDEVILSEKGTEIVDYKTGHFSEEDLEYLEEQVHYYAGLWEETRGEIPSLGRIEFLIDDRYHEFSIGRQRARSILSDARRLATNSLQKEWLLKSNLGKHCQICDYRPWCEDYWLPGERDRVLDSSDIDGVICVAHSRDSQAFCICHENVHIMIVNRDLQALPLWKQGLHIRALDMLGNGPVRFRTVWSEIFYVADAK